MSVEKQSADDSGPAVDQSGEGTDQNAEPVREAAAEDQPEALPLDQVFGILKNKRRRTVLHYLDQHEGPISLGELSEYVAADENDVPVAQISSRERKCAYVGLYQCHLPKMDDMDIVEFNQDRGLIETGPHEDQLKQYLDWANEPAQPWPLYYAAVAAAGVLAGLVAMVLGSGPVAMATCVAALVGVVGIALFQWHVDKDREAPLAVPFVDGDA